MILHAGDSLLERQSFADRRNGSSTTLLRACSSAHLNGQAYAGPDKQPRKKRSTAKAQEAPGAQVEEVEAERAQEAAREAAVDADVAAGRW